MKGKIEQKESGEVFQAPVTRLYDFLREHTKLSCKHAAVICFCTDLIFWLGIGCLAGWLFCLVAGNRDYYNIICGTGAFLAIVMGVAAGLIQIFLHAGESA